MPEYLSLTRELCRFATGVVADDNVPLFARIAEEIPLEMHAWPSGQEHNGWVVPDNWRVHTATISRDGKVVFDGTMNTLGVGRYSRSFSGILSWDELRPHLVSDPQLPDAYVFHCQWQYRPWDADWAMCMPHDVFATLGPGMYEVDLVTSYEPGEMLMGVATHRGRSDETIVLHSNNCHPHMANDGFAGTAVLVRLFQWLQAQDTHYTYQLVIGPEHLGTVFYLRDHEPEELDRIVCGIFAEMPGTQGPVKATSTFLGGQPIDQAIANAAAHHAVAHEMVPWRQGAGNDETVWEAPGYEVPFIEVTRSEELMRPYRGYHTSLDNPDLMDHEKLQEFFEVLRATLQSLEDNVVLLRLFDGLVCLSNPRYDLYVEREDPSIGKSLAPDQEAWGYLLDCLLRYMDGDMTVLDIAQKHGLPAGRVRAYIQQFADAGLVELTRAGIPRHPVHRTGMEAGS